MQDAQNAQLQVYASCCLQHKLQLAPHDFVVLIQACISAGHALTLDLLRTRSNPSGFESKSCLAYAAAVIAAVYSTCLVLALQQQLPSQLQVCVSQAVP